MYKPPKEGKKDNSYHKECLNNSEKAGHREDVVVKWDNNEFYIDSKCSVSAHKFHQRVSVDCIHIPTRLIPMEEREHLIALADACVGTGVGRHFLYSKLGKYILNAKVLWDVPMCSDKTALLSTITTSNGRHVEKIDHSGDPIILPINKMMTDAKKMNVSTVNHDYLLLLHGLMPNN
eukprot:15361226-Ditylum_brightwellii.AAC.1